MRHRRYRRYYLTKPVPNRSDVQLYSLPVSTLKAQLSERLAIVEGLSKSVESSSAIKREQHRLALQEYQQKKTIRDNIISRNRQIQNEIKSIEEADFNSKSLLSIIFHSNTLSPVAMARIETLKSQIEDPGPEIREPILTATDKERLLADQMRYIEVWLKPALAKAEKREAKERKIQDREQRVAAKRAITEALAASHIGKTRELAEDIKKVLRRQIEVFPSCPYCFEALGDEPHADHIIPVSRGGLSILNNMVLICASCNLSKSDLTLREFVKAYQLDWSRIEATLEKLGKRF